MKKYIQPEVQEKKSLINNPILIEASFNGQKLVEDGGDTSSGNVTEGDAKLRDEWSDGLW
jgi:hypothetical protein